MLTVVFIAYFFSLIYLQMQNILASRIYQRQQNISSKLHTLIVSIINFLWDDVATARDPLPISSHIQKVL